MESQIDAIFLDVGNTLRILTANEQHQAKARKRITEILSTGEDPVDFGEKLDTRYKVYRKWAFEHRMEAHEPELWTRWLAPEFPVELVVSNAVELTYQYRQSMGLRVMVPDCKEVIIELNKRGYLLGIISNVITSQEIPDWLEADGLNSYFQSLALSSVLGIRKPDPTIYQYAAEQAGVDPKHCVYVGDNMKRDITGTRDAGFGMVIILTLDPMRYGGEPQVPTDPPDLIIHHFRSLLDIFPERPQVFIPQHLEGMQ